MLTSPESAHIARPDGIGDDVPQRWLELANANCGNAFAAERTRLKPEAPHPCDPRS